MLTSLNDQLFLRINAPLHPDAIAVALAEVAANDIVYAAMALVVALWIWGPPERRAALLGSVAGVSIGIGINQLLGMLWYEPRPFVAGLGHTLIAHAADNSFPSDHGTFMWSLGFALIVTGATRRWGALVCLAGLPVAWARVYLGVHFPLDMLASLAVAQAGALMALAVQPLLQGPVTLGLQAVYIGGLRLLRLPPVLFPRETDMTPQIQRGPRA